MFNVMPQRLKAKLFMVVVQTVSYYPQQTHMYMDLT